MLMLPRDNPFEHFDRTVRQMFGHLSDGEQRKLGQARRVPYADQYIEDNHLVVTMDIPGVDKEDIEASVKESRKRQHLMIAGKDSETNIQRQFRQQIPLKERVDPKSSEAEYNNGILTIRLKLDKPDDSGTKIQID